MRGRVASAGCLGELIVAEGPGNGGRRWCGCMDRSGLVTALRAGAWSLLQARAEEVPFGAPLRLKRLRGYDIGGT
jgi:hypothetical protein